MTPSKICSYLYSQPVVECLTGGVVGLSLSGGTMLFPCARHVILYLVLVQPRICPDMTDIFDWDVKYQL